MIDPLSDLELRLNRLELGGVVSSVEQSAWPPGIVVRVANKTPEGRSRGRIPVLFMGADLQVLPSDLGKGDRVLIHAEAWTRFRKLFKRRRGQPRDRKAKVHREAVTLVGISCNRV